MSGKLGDTTVLGIVHNIGMDMQTQGWKKREKLGGKRLRSLG
jgi:hypothetical protein